MRRSLKQINARAEKLGLIITRWSPGDKVIYRALNAKSLDLIPDFRTTSLGGVERLLQVYEIINNMSESIRNAVDSNIVGEINEKAKDDNVI